MKEARRRDLARAVRNLEARETALENARIKFSELVYEAVRHDGDSLNDVSKALESMNHRISRQRVHQIVAAVHERDSA